MNTLRIPRSKPSGLCRWACGRKANNHSGICDHCWHDSSILRSSSDEGHAAWIARYKAKAKQPNPNRVEAGLRAAKKRAANPLGVA